MRAAFKIITALVLFGIGVLTGLHLLSSEPPEQKGLFADQALARAVIEASAVELTQSDCFLPTRPEVPVTVADFLLGYAAAIPLERSILSAECGGRGVGKCSVGYSVQRGEKADTSILLFSRDDDGKLMAEDVTCIAQ